MIPDFSKKTIDTLAKRASYKCSNPDCKINTTGPNSNPEKATTIGEAAHIYGARMGSKRYNHNMTDSSRAEITNAIWLCRNCHKLIDTDEQKYSSNILFAWRVKHEEFIASNLGNITDKMVYVEQNSNLKEFDEYPPIVKRIIIDKPDGWEYRLTSELMKFLNAPLFRKLNDLKNGLYVKELSNISSENAFNWIQNRLSELSLTVKPAIGLLDLLTKSWGKPGEPGNVKEIHHATKLIKGYLEHIILLEEKVHFVNVPVEYEKLVSLLKNLIGSQAEKLSTIPSDLEGILTLIENTEKENKLPKQIKKEFVFEIPDYWEKEFNKELNKLGRKENYKINNSSGCLTLLFVFVISIIILI